MKRLEKVGMWAALIVILPFTKISLNIQQVSIWYRRDNNNKVILQTLKPPDFLDDNFWQYSV